MPENMVLIVRPVDVNHSQWDNTLEEKAGKYCAVRLGFRQVKGLREEDMQVLIAARGAGYTSINQLSDAGVPQAAIEKLTDADAFRSLNLDRRQALWEVPALQRQAYSLILPASHRKVQWSADHLAIDDAGRARGAGLCRYRLILKGTSGKFCARKTENCCTLLQLKELDGLKDGDPVKVAGLVTVRQRPGTAKGNLFITIEDETGSANAVVFEKLFNLFRKEISLSYLLMVEGKLQREGEVVHVILKRCFNLTKMLNGITIPDKKDLPVKTLSRSDETSIPAEFQQPRIPLKDNKQKAVFHKGRNFR